MTPIDLLEREEAPPMAKPEEIDLDLLASMREARWQVRYDRHMADLNLDPRLRDLYFDRTIVDTDWIAEYLGYSDSSKGRISVMRDGKARIVPTSLAMALGLRAAIIPSLDVSIGVKFGRIRPGTEKGRIEEWALKDHRRLWDSVRGVTVLNQSIRQGRPRHTRPTLGPKWDADPDIRREMRNRRAGGED